MQRDLAVQRWLGMDEKGPRLAADQTRGVTALLVAGSRPGIDPLAAHFGAPAKALVEIAGEPMVSHVAHVLAAHPGVSRTIVLAQDPGALMRHPGTQWMGAHPRISALAGGNSVSAAVGAALDANPDGWPFLVTTADHVLLDAAMLGEFIGKAVASGCDVAVGLVPRSVFKRAYPESRRTWLKFRGNAYSGANLYFLRTPAAATAVAFWQRVESERKRARAVAGAFGLPLLAAYLLRLLDVRQALAAAGRKLGVKAVPIELSSPEACIDVDNVADHATVSAIIAARSAG